MRLGWTVSGVGHLGLIFVVLFGGLFAGKKAQEPIVLSEVSILSEEEFAALTRPASAPDTQSDAPEITLPDATPDAPEPPQPDTTPEVSTPDPVDAPDSPDSPDFQVEPPVPQAVVVEDAPPEPVAPTDSDGSTSTPDQLAAPAPRVAPVPQVAPPPEAETGPELVDSTAPDPEAPAEQPEEQFPAETPETASDRIVTEAEEEKTYAPASSKRPRARPSRPTRVAEPERPTPSTDDAVAAALAEDEPRQTAPNPGPPLTGREKEDFRLAVSSCWNVGSLSTEALNTTVVVAFEMERSGKPVTDSIRQLSFSGGSDAGARQAFQAARRAIIRCGARGFNLPVEKYDQWREIEATFNPQGMQFR